MLSVLILRIWISYSNYPKDSMSLKSGLPQIRAIAA